MNYKELGFVKVKMEEAGMVPTHDALAINNFAFTQFAEMAGWKGVEVENEADILPAILKAQNTVYHQCPNGHGKLLLPPQIE